MAEFNNSQLVGAFEVAAPVSDTADTTYDRLRRHDPNTGYAGHHQLHAFPASFMCLNLYILTTANNNTKRSGGLKVPFPVKIFAIDVACETSAAAAANIDVFVDTPTAAAASILNAAENVKATLTAPQRVAPEDGSEDVVYNTEIYITQQSTDAQNTIGGQAHIWAQRL